MKSTPPQTGSRRQSAWWLGVSIAALVGGLAGAIFVFPLGLIVAGVIVLPLTMGAAALFAAISASWVATFLAPDRSRSRILPIVAACEAIAGVVTLAILVLRLSPATRLESPSAILVLGLLFIVPGTSVVTRRLRRPRSGLRRDALLTVGLLVLAVLIVVAAVWIASLFGLAGA